MPERTFLQQFKEAETTFHETYSYQNTGAIDNNSIVAQFFVNAYTLRALAELNDDPIGRFGIDNNMHKHELAFGLMLGGPDELDKVKEAAHKIAVFLTNAPRRVDGQRKIVTEMTFSQN